MAELSEEGLRRSLRALGYNPGPITAATRRLYEGKLSRLRGEARRSMGSSKAPEDRPTPARRSWAGPPQSAPAWEEEDEPPWTPLTDPKPRAWTPLAAPTPRTPLAAPTPRVCTPLADPTPRAWTYQAASNSRAWTPPSATPTPPAWATPTTETWFRGPEDPPTPWARKPTVWDSEGEEQQEEPPRRPVPPRRGPPARTLERLLSRLLAAASLVLLCVFLGILWVKSAGNPPGEKMEQSLRQVQVDCDGKTDSYCVTEQKKIEMRMLFELYNFLAKQAANFECGNPDRLKSKCIPLEEAREFVVNASGHPLEKFDTALKWMIGSNRDLGIWVRGDDPFSEPVTSLDKVACLESTRPRLWLSCRLRLALATAVTNLILFFWGLAFLWGVLALLKYRWRKLEEEEQAMFDLVKNITAVVQDHYKDWECNMETVPYIGVFHVRDTLIPPRNRKKMLPVWEKAVDFLSANESRIRTESHRIAGEDMLVWRWTRSAKYPGS